MELDIRGVKNWFTVTSENRGQVGWMVAGWVRTRLKRFVRGVRKGLGGLAYDGRCFGGPGGLELVVVSDSRRGRCQVYEYTVW